MQNWMKVVAMVVVLTGGACVQSNTTSGHPATNATSYRALGRHVVTEAGHLQFAWPASGIETRFQGRRLSVTLEDTGSNILDITIDGNTQMLHLKKGQHDYVLMDENSARQHNVTITRRSEIFDNGLTELVSLDTDGQFLQTPAPARRILVLGDSISVGFGAEGADENCEYTPETGAPLRSYVALSANAFGADLHDVAISGRGLIRNYDESPDPLMPYLLDKALPDTQTDWDHSAYQPHVILINLGTNDYALGDPGEGFYTAYVKLLGTLRAYHPNARIYAAYSPMGVIEPDRISAVEYTKRALETRRKSGDENIGYIYLPQAESGHIYGCAYHPGIDSHKAMADVFIDRLAADMGWAKTPSLPRP